MQRTWQTIRSWAGRGALWLPLVLLAACATTAPGDEPPAPGAVEAENQRRALIKLQLAELYLYGRGQPETALEEVRQAIAASPNFGPAYNLRGLIYSRLGELRLAEDNFKRALQINPRDADSMHNYGWFLCSTNRHPEAQAQFDQALALPTYREIERTLMAKGICQARAGQLAEAERSLSRAYEVDPANPVTAVNLSEVLYRRGEYERARFYIRRVNTLPEVSNAQTLWLAARIENRIGNPAGVKAFGDELRARFPNSPEALQYARGRFDD